jgi:predicted Rossmann fold flavoprotein
VYFWILENAGFMKKDFDVIVVGAGAAGLVAAASAAENGASVLLLEKMERAGRKLLITGNGRCNITNVAPMSDFIKEVFPNGRYLKKIFSRFFSNEILEILHQHGLETVTERGGRVFPVDNVAKSVVQALLRWTAQGKVEILFKSRVDKLLVENESVQGVEVIIDGEKTKFSAKSVIVCTGGKSYPATGSTGDGFTFAQNAGHKIEATRPALVPIETEGDLASKLMGLALKNVKASLWVNGKKMKDDFGELLITHFGLSGPIILSLSRTVVDELDKNNEVEISIDLKPALDDQKLDARLLRDLNENGKKRVANVFRLWLPSKMIGIFMEILNIDPNKESHQLSGKERRKVRLLLKDFRFKVTGYRPFKEAIITAGGVDTSEIDAKTMESKIVKNLYFAGEVLNLDANTGGYNLQIAWSTGWVAGKASCPHES